MKGPLSERNVRLLAQWLAGVPTPQIAVEFGVCTARVKQLAARHRIPRFRLVGRPRAAAIPLAEFWDHVDKSAGKNGCWPWTGHVDANGYGQGLAHRKAWRLTVGPIPAGRMVLHGCDNPPCCNPAHLRLGDAQDNIWDAIDRGRWRQSKRPSVRP